MIFLKILYSQPGNEASRRAPALPRQAMHAICPDPTFQFTSNRGMRPATAQGQNCCKARYHERVLGYLAQRTEIVGMKFIPSEQPV
jgi:hypothetical protein